MVQARQELCVRLGGILPSLGPAGCQCLPRLRPATLLFSLGPPTRWQLTCPLSGPFHLSHSPREPWRALGVGKGQALGLDGLGDLWQAMVPLWMSLSHTQFYKLPQSASPFWPVQPTSTAPLGQAVCRVLDGQQTRP